MPRAQILVTAILALPAFGADFSGARALEYTRRSVAFGPRPSGSPAIRKLQAYIHAQLRTCNCKVTDDDFTARTPAGPIPMKNIIAAFPGAAPATIVITGHYDTKRMPEFVGANDGGSSTGLLLELADVLAATPHRLNVVLVWFDGEEAVREWSGTDSLYGSRHLAAKWAADGTLSKISALINVDMIGDRDLGILPESASTPSIRATIWGIAAKLGYSRHFLNDASAIEDDHLPFLERGVPSLDLIDFDYRWWHTPEDTLDKLSAASLEVVGRVLVRYVQ